MKKLLLFLMSVLFLFSLVGCDAMFKASNVYTETSVDADGNEIVIEYMYYPNDNDRIARKTIYDKNGNIDVSYNYYEDGVWSEEYYDENDLRNLCITHYLDGTKGVEEFIPSGIRVKNSTYGPSGTLQRVDEFRDDGTQYAMTEYNVNGISKRYMLFNEQEKPILDEITQSDGATVTTTTTCLENEQPVSVEYFIRATDGTFISHYKEYIANGNITKTVAYDENGTIIDEWSEK